MSLDKKFNVLLILTISFFFIVFSVIILGSFFPNPTLAGMSWSIWTVLGSVLLYVVATFLFTVISRKRDKKKSEDME